MNIISGHTTSVASDGVHGVLRAGSEWEPESTASDLDLPVDDLFAPEFQQWNSGSYWWDEDPSVNDAPVHYTIELDGLFTFRRFVVQADDNDGYVLEWWDGGAWQTAWEIPPIFSFGLVTRDSGAVGPITTSRLRLSATSGDNFYAISEVQGFAVPEPASWLLMIAGLGLAGLGLRATGPTQVH